MDRHNDALRRGRCGHACGSFSLSHQRWKRSDGNPQNRPDQPEPAAVGEFINSEQRKDDALSVTARGLRASSGVPPPRPAAGAPGLVVPELQQGSAPAWIAANAAAA